MIQVSSYNYINNSSKNIYTLLKDSTNVLGAGGTAVFSSSNQGKYFIKHDLIGSPTLYPSYGGYLNFLPQNAEGYYRADIFEDTESNTTDGWERGSVLMVKILK